MFIATAHNVTGGVGHRADGTSDYTVWVGINAVCIFSGTVNNHVRKEGGAKLLRLIADAMDNCQKGELSEPARIHKPIRRRDKNSTPKTITRTLGKRSKRN